jgi:hypothetical protein
MRPRHVREGTTDRELLDRCANGDLAAIDRLVDRYVVEGVAIASRLAGECAQSDRLLDAVHDAFITAFDEALDGDADSPAPEFNRMITEFATALSASSDRWSNGDPAPITDAETRQLRRDVVTEVRLTVELRLESPRTLVRGHGLLAELRKVRRRWNLPSLHGARAGELRVFVR